jgi:hypothetical protein
VSTNEGRRVPILTNYYGTQNSDRPGNGGNMKRMCSIIESLSFLLFLVVIRKFLNTFPSPTKITNLILHKKHSRPDETPPSCPKNPHINIPILAIPPTTAENRLDVTIVEYQFAAIRKV